MTTLELEKGVALKNLLVATDFSEVSRHALEYAAVLARHSGARIHIAHVLPADPFLPIPLEPTPMALDGEPSQRSAAWKNSQPSLNCAMWRTKFCWNAALWPRSCRA